MPKRICENCIHWKITYDNLGFINDVFCELGVFMHCAMAGLADYFEIK